MRTMNKCLILLSVMCSLACARYQATTLMTIGSDADAYSQHQHGVTVRAYAFTEEDCKRYLGRNVIEKGFQPIQFTVENNTNKYLMFSTAGLSIPCADPLAVADQVHTSTAGRSTAYGVGALFVWPLIVPAIVDGVRSSKANDQLNRDFLSKSIQEQTIAPHMNFNGVVFVPIRVFQTQFALTLIDRDTREKLVYQVHIKRPEVKLHGVSEEEAKKLQEAA